MLVKINKNRILVVDDDCAIRKFLTVVLKREGYEVEVAGNGLEALNLIRENPSNYFDLIFLDMQMPVMDGWRFLQIYRQETDQAQRAPIIVMTAAMTAARYASQIMADGLLPKPFCLEELPNLVRKFLPVESNVLSNHKALFLS